MSFLSFSLVLDIQIKTINILSSRFPTSLCFTILLFSFFIFFSFHSLKHWRTVNIHVNIPCKLLSPPVLVDSTRFSLYAIMEVSRKPKHTHFKYQFQNIHFSCAVIPRSNFDAVAGDENYLISRFFNFSSLFFGVQVKVLALQKSTLAFVWLGKFLYIAIFCW